MPLIGVGSETRRSEMWDAGHWLESNFGHPLEGIGHDPDHHPDKK